MLRALALLAALSLAAVGIIALPAATAAPTVTTSPTVEVKFEHGHGSGVHIGGGMILTAAHVADEGYNDPALRSKTVQIRAQNGAVQWGVVLWINKRYDIALVRIFDYANISTVEIADKPVRIGDALHAEGNPFDMEDITTYGRVASKVQSYPKYWEAIFFINGEVRPGMSGGPCFNERGELVGINVGQVVENNGFAVMLPSMGMIVPIDAIRDLLPRV